MTGLWLIIGEKMTNKPLIKNSEAYRGLYVTTRSFDSQIVVSSSASASEAYDEAKEKGYVTPVLIYVPTKEEDRGGMVPMFSEASSKEGKDPAAVSLGRKGGLKGGKARAEKLTKEKLSEIGRAGAEARWGKDKMVKWGKSKPLPKKEIISIEIADEDRVKLENIMNNLNGFYSADGYISILDLTEEAMIDLILKYEEGGFTLKPEDF